MLYCMLRCAPRPLLLHVVYTCHAYDSMNYIAPCAVAICIMYCIMNCTMYRPSYLHDALDEVHDSQRGTQPASIRCDVHHGLRKRGRV